MWFYQMLTELLYANVVLYPGVVSKKSAVDVKFNITVTTLLF